MWDLVAACRLLRSEFPANVPIVVAGERGAAVLGTYAALWAQEIDQLLLDRPLLTHADADAPQLLNVLRVCDVPEAIGMLAPRAVTITGISGRRLDRVQAIYRAVGTAAKLRIAGKDAPKQETTADCPA